MDEHLRNSQDVHVFCDCWDFGRHPEVYMTLQPQLFSARVLSRSCKRYATDVYGSFKCITTSDFAYQFVASNYE